MKRPWLMVGLVVAGLALGAWALVQFAPPPEGTAIGRRAPAYRLVALETGDSVDVRDHFAGHVTLLNVWATWCAPCRAEMPSMERIWNDYRDRGFRIAAVSVDVGDPAKIRAFANELGLTFDMLHDATGEIQQVYRMIGVPQSFLLDRDGTIRYMALGEEQWDTPEHRARIEGLLDE
jgi:peroxiredoxin